MSIIQQARWPVNLLRTVVDVSLALHLAAAAAWWWISPKGFPFDRVQFWSNAILPVLTILFAVAGLWAMHRGNVRGAALVVLCFAAAWLGAACAMRLYFPISLAGKWLVVLLAGVTGTVLYGMLVRQKNVGLLSSAAAIFIGTVVGTGVVWGQIPRPASTVPSNQIPQTTQIANSNDVSIDLGDSAQYQASSAMLMFSTEEVKVTCSPLLTFDRTSPDRFWSLFAPRLSRAARRCIGQGGGPIGFEFRYDDGSTVLLSAPTSAGVLELTAYTPLATDTYSHLNSFCEIAVDGRGSLSLVFSPCSERPVDVLPAEYPVGRPARMACLDESGDFRVVEATSGEKGPFRTLAKGKLHRGEPLTITIRSEEIPAASLTLHDWTAQVSTDLSPTAGWEFPLNAIEFQRESDALDSPLSIWITLASTSVGRGYDTVGHRAGMYRNRITICTPGRD